MTEPAPQFTLDDIKTVVAAELDEVNRHLAELRAVRDALNEEIRDAAPIRKLRAQRDEVAAQIRGLVAAQEEKAGILARLEPRKRTPKPPAKKTASK